MATRAELELARRALNRLTGTANADLRAFLAAVDREDRETAARLLESVYPALMQEYGQAAAALGADLAESWVSDLGTRPQLQIATPLTPAQSIGLAGWALKQNDWRGQLALVTDQYVKQPYRDTVQRTAHRSGVAWARVPMGATTCAFCMLIASRGAVFRSAGAAGANRKYHGDCDCAVTVVRTEEDFPEGYDPNGYMDVYLAGRDVASASGEPVTTKAVLAGMRQVADLH